jgi:hypothetical protein
MSSTRTFTASATATLTAANTLPSPVQLLDRTLPAGVFDKASLELISIWRDKVPHASARPAAARRSVCSAHSSEWRDPRAYRLDRAHVRPQAMRCTG